MPSRNGRAGAASRPTSFSVSPSRSMLRACWSARRPSAVRLTPRPPRSKKRTPSSRSRAATAADRVGWVTKARRATALPLIEGFSAFWRGDHRAAVELLHPARLIANSFGGSHAQRDIVDWTLTEAALRGGLSDVAEALAHERLALKPHSPINRAFLMRARSATAATKLAA